MTSRYQCGSRTLVRGGISPRSTSAADVADWPRSLMPLDPRVVVRVPVDRLELREIRPHRSRTESRQPAHNDRAVIELNALELGRVRRVAVAAFDVVLGHFRSIAGKEPHPIAIAIGHTLRLWPRCSGISRPP